MSGVLVTAIGSMSADHVLRALRRRGHAPIVGTDIHPAAWLPASPLADRVHLLRPDLSPDDYAARLLSICREAGIRYLVPLTDPEVDLLAPRAASFLREGVVVCVSPPQAVERCRDKQFLCDFFSSDATVAVIPTVRLQASAPGPFPLLAKPRRGRSSQGLFSIEDEAALAYARQRLGDTHVLQPRLPGEVVVVDVVRHPSGGPCVAVARTELLRTSNGAGMTVRMSDAAEPAAAARHAAEKLGVHGCINLEFLHHDGRYLLMDANPRFSAGVAFSALAGYDMVAAHLACFEGGELPAAVVPKQAIFARRIQEMPAHENEPE